MDRALPLLEEALKLTTAKLGADHPLATTAMSNLAGGYRDAGRMDRALPLFEEALEVDDRQAGCRTTPPPSPA